MLSNRLVALSLALSSQPVYQLEDATADHVARQRHPRLRVEPVTSSVAQNVNHEEHRHAHSLEAGGEVSKTSAAEVSSTTGPPPPAASSGRHAGERTVADLVLQLGRGQRKHLFV
jgi:hypothetical protein